MAIQLGTTYRNAAADQFETSVGTAARLQIRTGAQPANCAAADSGTLLAELTLPSDWLAAASSGSKALSGSWTGTGSNAGTAAHFRVKDSAGTVCHLQGSVTATGGGGDMTVQNLNIAAGQTITITSFSITASGA
jgi:hypothetical protein